VIPTTADSEEQVLFLRDPTRRLATEATNKKGKRVTTVRRRLPLAVPHQPEAAERKKKTQKNIRKMGRGLYVASGVKLSSHTPPASSGHGAGRPRLGIMIQINLHVFICRV
jgi:hypothetical protein